MSSRLKQATISSLKGVVVIEDIMRYKAALELKGQTEDDIIELIECLKRKKPCKEVLTSTGIADVLKQLLTSHKSEKVVNEVEKLLDYWNIYADNKRQPTIEVRYDNLTRHIRQTSLRYFLNELGGTEEDEKLANILEKELFHRNKKLISKSYRQTSRKIIFALRHNAEKRESLKKGQISPIDFVIQYQK